MNHRSAWIDTMTIPFDKTAYSERRFRRLTHDYPRDTQVEQSDDFGRFAAALTMLGFCVTLGYFLLKRIFG